jgi:peptide/nickel transport system substrate-binding protein
MRVLSLKLRDDVEFTDGTAFDAEAVQANMEHLANGTGQNSYMAQSVTDFEIVSDTEINLILAEPDPGLESYLAVVGGAMASPASLAEPNAASEPVGSGPYTLDAGRTTPGTQYVYERNPDYWNAEAFPYDEIVVKPIADATARLNALKSGQADVASVPATSVAEAEASGLTVNRYPTDWHGLILADRAGDSVPALSDADVRRAINYVFDKESILENLQLGEGELTSQTFNEQNEAFIPELDTAYEYDLERARDLMAEAGYADGFEVTMPDFAAFAQVAPIIEQQLAEINITVEFEQVAADATISELLSGKFPMFWFSLGSQGAWQDFRKFAFSESPWNTAKVDDPAMDALLEAAQGPRGGVGGSQ